MTDPASTNELATTADRRAVNGGQSTETEPNTAAWRLAVANRVSIVTKPFEWLLRIARIIETAIPIGLLRRHEIQKAVHSAYAEAPDFYDPSTYPIRYEEQLLPVIQRTTGSIDGHRLLDLYCGHGREAEIFARAGFKVFAVDAQPAVIERARAYARHAGFHAEFEVADIDRWCPSDADWDIVYTSLWMYSTVPDRDARIAWLKRLSGWLSPGGYLVISVTPGSTGLGPKLRHAVAWLVRLLSLNSRRPEFGDRFHTGLFWHDFTSPMLNAELNEAGLEIVESLEIDDGTPCNMYLLRVPTGGE